jgi:hypothetical protein
MKGQRGSATEKRVFASKTWSWVNLWLLSFFQDCSRKDGLIMESLVMYQCTFNLCLVSVVNKAMICYSCSTSWPSKKMLPETYRTNKSAVSNVCVACDWLSRGFRNALLEGNFDILRRSLSTRLQHKNQKKDLPNKYDNRRRQQSNRVESNQKIESIETVWCKNGLKPVSNTWNPRHTLFGTYSTSSEGYQTKTPAITSSIKK